MRSVEWIIVKKKGKNGLRLQLPSEHRVTNGLHIIFNPSIYWIEKHPHETPHMRTDLIAGDHHYELPKRFRAASIMLVLVDDYPLQSPEGHPTGAGAL